MSTRTDAGSKASPQQRGHKPRGQIKEGKSLVIDGQKIAGNVIPFPTDDRTAVKVEVTPGA